MILQIKFDMVGPLVSEVFTSESVYRQTDSQTNGCRLESHPISSPCERAFGSGELITLKNRQYNEGHKDFGSLLDHMPVYVLEFLRLSDLNRYPRR